MRNELRESIWDAVMPIGIGLAGYLVCASIIALAPTRHPRTDSAPNEFQFLQYGKWRTRNQDGNVIAERFDVGGHSQRIDYDGDGKFDEQIDFPFRGRPIRTKLR